MLRERLDGKQPVHPACGCRSAVGPAFVFGEAVGQHPCQHTTSWSAETQLRSRCRLVHLAAGQSRRTRSTWEIGIRLFNRQQPVSSAEGSTVSTRRENMTFTGRGQERFAGESMSRMIATHLPPFGRVQVVLVFGLTGALVSVQTHNLCPSAPPN